MESGLFGFWLRFSSVTGFFKNLLLRRSLAKNQKSSLFIATSFLSMLQRGSQPQIDFRSAEDDVVS